VTPVVSEPELTRLLAGLRPSELALRDWVAPRLSASMIEHMAAAEYGFDVPGNREAIEDLRHFGQLPEDLPWPPQEVLSLMRWSRVDESKLDADAARCGHLMRLFSCVVLVRARTANAAPVNSLMPMVHSAVALGPEAVEAAGSYVAWCRLHKPGDWRDDPLSLPFLTLTLVVVSALLPAGRGPELIPRLIGMFVEELSDTLAEEGLSWTQRPVRDMLKRVALSESRRMLIALASRCLFDGPAQESGHGVQLARLGEAIRGDLVADADELRALLVSDT
jgi:hypothetical protein